MPKTRRLGLPLLAPILVSWLLATPAVAQTETTRTDRLSVGTGGEPATGTVRLTGLGSAGGTGFLLSDAVGDLIKRAIARADLPSPVAYEDESNTFSSLQTFSAGIATTTLTASSTVAISGVTTHADTTRSTTYTSQTTGWAITAAGAADFRRLYTDELHAREFIADLEMALNGGQTVAKSVVILALPFTCPAAAGAATIRVRDFPGFPNLRVFAANDWVVLRSFSRTDSDSDGNTDLTIGDCVGQVSSYADQADNTQTWTFTRGSGGSAGSMATSTVIPAEAVVIDYGVSGQGFLLARANDGAEGVNAPYWQINTWATAPVAANMAVRMRCGNLNGSYGYSSAIYGCAFGDSAGANLTIDATNGLRIRAGTTNKLVADGAGNLSIASGNVTIDANGIQIAPTTSYAESRALVWNDTHSGGLRKPGAYYDEPASGQGRLYLSNDAGATTSEIYLFNRETSTSGHRSILWSMANSAGSRFEFYANNFVDFKQQTSAGTTNDRLRIVLNNDGADPGFPTIRSDGNSIHITSSSGGVFVTEVTTTDNLWPMVSNAGQILVKNNVFNGAIVVGGCTITVQSGIITAKAGGC